MYNWRNSSVLRRQRNTLSEEESITEDGGQNSRNRKRTITESSTAMPQDAPISSSLDADSS